MNLTLGGTATAGADYAVWSGGTRTGNTVPRWCSASAPCSTTITIHPVDDTLVEPSETVTLTVTTGTGYSVGTPSSATGTITDNDVNPVVTVDRDRQLGLGRGRIRSRSRSPARRTPARSVVVNLTWGGAATFSTDYTVSVSSGATLSANGQQLTLDGGVATVTLTVTPVDDIFVEPSESVALTIATGTGYAVGSPASATATILDNDAASLYVSDFTVTEGDNKTTTISIPITLSGPLTSAVTFTITTVAGTATAGTDFQTKTSTLTIAAGQTQVVFQVAIVNDRVAEPTETFTVTISSVDRAPIARAPACDDRRQRRRADDVRSCTCRVAVEPLTRRQLEGAVAQAKAQWLAVRPSADFSGVTFEIGDLPELQLGFALDRRIVSTPPRRAGAGRASISSACWCTSSVTRLGSSMRSRA